MTDGKFPLSSEVTFLLPLLLHFSISRFTDGFSVPFLRISVMCFLEGKMSFMLKGKHRARLSHLSRKDTGLPTAKITNRKSRFGWGPRSSVTSHCLTLLTCRRYFLCTARTFSTWLLRKMRLALPISFHKPERRRYVWQSLITGPHQELNVACINPGHLAPGMRDEDEDGEGEGRKGEKRAAFLRDIQDFEMKNKYL